MAEAHLQNSNSEDFGRPDTTTSNGAGHQNLGRLFREATRLLDATDLGGANETLKAVEQVLYVKRWVFDLGHRW